MMRWRVVALAVLAVLVLASLLNRKTATACSPSGSTSQEISQRQPGSGRRNVDPRYNIGHQFFDSHVAAHRPL